MLKKEGVYTTKCPKCSHLMVIHLLSDGSISPNKCPDCEVEFAGLENGEERNTFVIVPKEKAKELTIVVNEEANKTDKKSFATPPWTKKADKKSFKW